MSRNPATPAGQPRRKFAPLLGIFLMLLLVCPAVRAAEPGLFQFHHEGVLGTSLDLQVRATDEAQAALVESTALAEIERLRKILSTYDPGSEISRFNTSAGSMKCSPELLDVLGFYDLWNAKSAGAYNGHLGELIAAWKAAEKAGAPPDAATLQRIVRTLGQPGWKVDRAAGTATRFPGGAITIDSLGKGYIISKAAVAVRTKLPTVQGFLLNIGGDIFASGVSAPGMPWTVGVADPKRTADNAPPLTQVRISNRAISTSAAYERGFTVGERRFSHILDPRTGLPADGVASATVIASNTANSNALATTLCVLKPEQGLTLVRQTPDVECLIIAADGRQFRSPRFSSLEVRPSAPPIATAPPPKGGAWPAGYEVAIAITLKTPPPGGKGRPKRPYVAVWVEDESTQRVRTVAVWGNQRKYLPDLRTWWKVAQQDAAWAQSVTRATRSAGQHRIAWDGLDDQGKPVPAGTYTVFLEVNREHGTHAIESGKIVCGKVAAKGTISAASEFDAAEISFGPVGK
jgi:thiamine biosynthesis lipoprotein ApbE